MTNGMIVSLFMKCSIPILPSIPLALAMIQRTILLLMTTWRAMSSLIYILVNVLISLQLLSIPLAKYSHACCCCLQHPGYLDNNKLVYRVTRWLMCRWLLRWWFVTSILLLLARVLAIVLMTNWRPSSMNLVIAFIVFLQILIFLVYLVIIHKMISWRLLLRYSSTLSMRNGTSSLNDLHGILKYWRILRSTRIQMNLFLILLLIRLLRQRTLIEVFPYWSKSCTAPLIIIFIRGILMILIMYILKYVTQYIVLFGYGREAPLLSSCW